MTIASRLVAWLGRDLAPAAASSMPAGVTMSGVGFDFMPQAGRVQLSDSYSQHPIVHACVRLYADNIAGVPVYVYTGTQATRARWQRERLYQRDGQTFSRRVDGVKPVETGDYAKLFDRPNPMQTGVQFWQAVVSYLTYEGEVDIVCVDRIGWDKLPAELIPCPPQFFSPRPERAVVPAYWQYRQPGQPVKDLQPYELIRPRSFNPLDIRRGLSPLSVLGMTLQQDWSARLYNKAFFENDATPGGWILAEPGIVSKKEKRDESLLDWNKRHQGESKAFKWTIVDNAKAIVPAGVSPKDAQFMEGMAAHKEEVAMVFRAPMVLLSRTAGINFATDKAERRALWTTSFIPLIRHLEDVFWSELFQFIDGGQYWLGFDLSEVDDLREELGGKLDAAQKLVSMNVPFNVVNDRLSLGLPMIEGGDTALVGMNLIPMAMAVGGESAAPMPEAGTVPSALDVKTPAAAVDPNTALNGAQVAALQAIIMNVAAGYLPRDTGVQIIAAAFPLILAQAEAIMGSVGLSFKPTTIIDTPRSDGERSGLLIVSGHHRAKDWRKWNRKFIIQRLEYIGAFTKKYKRWLYEYRNEVLGNLRNVGRDAEWEALILGNRTLWDRKLADYLKAIYGDAYVSGADMTAKEIGTPPFLSLTSPAAIKALQARKVRIVGTNATLRDNLRKYLAEGLTAGDTTAQLQQRVKDIMNFQDARALTIARTEVGGTMSNARYTEMKEDGVGMHSWQTAGAAASPTPRETHLAAERGGPIKMGEIFGDTGCEYPCDPNGPAGEVINCRCCSVPEVNAPTIGKHPLAGLPSNVEEMEAALSG